VFFSFPYSVKSYMLNQSSSYFDPSDITQKRRSTPFL